MTLPWRSEQYWTVAADLCLCLGWVQEYHGDCLCRLMVHDLIRIDYSRTSALTIPSCSRVIRWGGIQGQLTFSEGDPQD